MPEKYLCIEEYLSSVANRRDETIEVEPQELVDEDWTEGFE